MPETVLHLKINHFYTVGVDLTADELGPVPAEFFACTLKSYATPFVSPVMVAPVVVLTPSLNVANELVPVLNLMT